MKNIDLKKLIEDMSLDKKEVAEHLFPGNKYPTLALNRVLAGNASLDENQISRLSLLTGISISNLYDGKKWDMKSTKDLITFSHGSFTAELNTNTWVTKIFDKGSVFHEEIIHSKAIPLSQYISSLNSIIIKYQKDE